MTPRYWTPCGRADEMKNIANGIDSFTTQAGTCYRLNAVLWNAMIRQLPGFFSTAGKFWLDGDEDAHAVALLWPDLVDQSAVYKAACCAYARVTPAGCIFYAFLMSPAGEAAKNIAAAFHTASLKKWRVTGAATLAEGFNVKLSRGNETRTVFMAEYPEQEYWTAGELLEVMACETA